MSYLCNETKIMKNSKKYHISNFFIFFTCWVLTYTSLMHLWNVTDVHKYIQPYKKGFEWGDVTLSLSIWHLSFSFASLFTPLSLYFKVQIMHTALFKIKGTHQGGAGGPHIFPLFLPLPPVLQVKSAPKIELQSQSTHRKHQVISVCPKMFCLTVPLCTHIS